MRVKFTLFCLNTDRQTIFDCTIATKRQQQQNTHAYTQILTHSHSKASCKFTFLAHKRLSDCAHVCVCVLVSARIDRLSSTSMGSSKFGIHQANRLYSACLLAVNSDELLAWKPNFPAIFYTSFLCGCCLCCCLLFWQKPLWHFSNSCCVYSSTGEWLCKWKKQRIRQRSNCRKNNLTILLSTPQIDEVCESYIHLSEISIFTYNFHINSFVK